MLACQLEPWRLFLSPAKAAARETLARYPSCFRILPFYAYAVPKKSPIGDLHDYSPCACAPGQTARGGGHDFPANITHTKTPDIHLHWAWLHGFPFRLPRACTQTDTSTHTQRRTSFMDKYPCGLAWPAPAWSAQYYIMADDMVAYISRIHRGHPSSLSSSPWPLYPIRCPVTSPSLPAVDLSVLLLAPAMSSFAPSRHGDLCRTSPDTVEHGGHQISVKKG